MCKNESYTWAITFLHGMAWIAIHYDKTNHLWLDNESVVIVSNIVIAILHDTGKNEHTRVTFTNHYDHVIGHSYNRRP